jgi:hypothetical protein
MDSFRAPAQLRRQLEARRYQGRWLVPLSIVKDNDRLMANGQLPSVPAELVVWNDSLQNTPARFESTGASA